MSESHISLSVSIQPESFYSMLSARSSPSVSHSQLPCNKASEGETRLHIRRMQKVDCCLFKSLRVVF